MNFDLPQFERLPISDIEEADKQIFYPTWKCFCCEDSGIVRSHLVRLVIPKYHSDKDKWPICQNCNTFSNRWCGAGMENFDSRFNFQLCQKLDLINRDNWRNTVERQVDIKKLAKSLEMPGSNFGHERSPEDERVILQRKSELEAYDWAKAAEDYYGD